MTLTNANATDHSTSTYTNPSVGNATVSFTSPPATCPSGQTGTPPNCTTPVSGGGTSGGSSGGSTGGGTSGSKAGNTKTTTPVTTPTTTPTTTPVTTTSGGTAPAVQQKDLEYTKAVFSMQTAVPTQVYVQYGLDKNTLDKQTSPSEFATTHDVTIEAGQLIPGETYYYIVVSKDQQGHIAQTSLQDFKTKGLTITVGVFDKDHKALRKKVISLHSTPMTGKTDAGGFVTFSDVTPGDHHVIYTEGKVTYDQSITVANNVDSSGSTQTAPTQNVAVVYSLTQGNGTTGRVLIITLLLVVVGAAALFVARRKAHPDMFGGVPVSMQPVVVGGGRTVSTPVEQTPDTIAPFSDELNRRLNDIPNSDAPTPGGTVSPAGEAHEERK